jgi:glycosyltransferase involved in cell wall biosynthesis
MNALEASAPSEAEGVLEDASQHQDVSIIITTYNHARFLPEAIESALVQTVAPSEVIVVDDGSTDDPASVVSRYPQVQLIHQRNQGLAAARNTGWRAARGRYLVFLDADDRLMPQALASNLKLFSERPECAFVHGSFDFIDAGGRHLRSAAPKFIGVDVYEAFLKGNFIEMHATVMYRHDRLEEVAGFDPRLRCCEDYELYLRLARRYPVAAGTDRIAEYRHHGSNMSNNIPSMLATVLGVMHRQRQYLAGNPRGQLALQTGIRNSKSYYAKLQVDKIFTMLRGSELRRIPFCATMRVFVRAPASFLKVACRRNLRALRSGMVRIRNKPVGFGDLRRVRPISPNFGFDRGGKPVDRRYIEDFLSRNAEVIRGRVLEVGDNAYTLGYGGARVTQSDVLHVSADNPRATLVGDLAEGQNLPSEAFDCIVLTQTLHLIFDMGKAIATLHRMLKPGGVLLLTVPGVSSVDSGEWGPSWYWSLTPAALNRLLGGRFDEENISMTDYGNVLAAVAFLHGLAEHELSPAELDAHDPQYPVIVAARAVKRCKTDHESAAKA